MTGFRLLPPAECEPYAPAVGDLLHGVDEAGRCVPADVVWTDGVTVCLTTEEHQGLPPARPGCVITLTGDTERHPGGYVHEPGTWHLPEEIDDSGEICFHLRGCP